MPNIPTPIRAALGLAATAVAEARKLPETLPQLPVVAVSTAMQASLRVQQHIAELAARGDEVISHLRGTSAEPPSWATFDDALGNPVQAAFDRAEPVNLEDTAEPSLQDLAELADTAEPGQAEPAHPVTPADLAMATPGEPSSPIEPAADDGEAAPAKAAKAAKKAPAKKAPAKTAPAKKAPAKAAAKKAPAKKATKRSEPLVEAARKADPSSGPNPSTMAAEILQAHQGESPDQQ